jgi:hypothetical protein
MRTAALWAAVLVALGPGVGGALGHGELFFQLGAERIQPGGQVEIRADLGAGDAFEVTLVAKADGGRRILGTIPATEEGHLQTYLMIPADVPAGDYLVELAYDLTVLRAPLTVAGAPIDPGEGGQQPGQDDGFGAPSPSGGGAAVPVVPGSSIVPASDGSSVRGTRSAADGLLAVVLAGGGAAVLLATLRILGARRRRTGQPQDAGAPETRRH